MEWGKQLDKENFERRSKASSNIQRAVYIHVVDDHPIITHVSFGNFGNIIFHI
ncbi:hypothetical protein [Streptococcus sp. E17BB]|uniref:hypothetical protein n=1 Tax=Streptococcus sp. E17BB TaxID=3278714 RepID=UPI00359EAECA